jgi:MFS transporter, DHA2 family, multidrug resistance protein
LNATLTSTKATGRDWIGLAVLTLPCVFYVLDFSVLNLALPAISAAFTPSSIELLWIVDMYGFLVSGSLITMGTLGDRIGRRRLLMIGAASFAVASVLAAFSTSTLMLIGARALLGVAGATLAPSTLSLIRTMFHDDQQRTFAIGIWGAAFAFGGTVGPVVGGVVLAHFWWGAVFLIGVPVMVLLLVLGPLLLPEFRDDDAAPLDLLSAALSIAAVIGSVYGLKSIAQDGLNPLAIATLAAGLALGALFIRRQSELPQPLIDLELFRSAPFVTALTTFALSAFVAFTEFLFVAQYLQLVLGLSALEAGLWMLPGSVVVTATSVLGPLIARRFRADQVIAASFMLVAIGLAAMTMIGGTASLALIVTGGVLMGLGLGPLSALLTDQIMTFAPVERAGSAAATSETSAELGGALGVAILGSIGVAVYRLRMATTLPGDIPTEAANAARGTLGGAVAVAGSLLDERGQLVLAAARAAYAQSLVVVVAISALLMLGSAIAVLLVLGKNAELQRRNDLEQISAI